MVTQRFTPKRLTRLSLEPKPTFTTHVWIEPKEKCSENRIASVNLHTYSKTEGNSFRRAGTSNSPLSGTWVYVNGSQGCDPTEEDCYFNTEGGNNERVTCSLGHLSHLETVSGWCPAGGASKPAGPTKHNVLCGMRPALEVILANEDFARTAAAAGKRVQTSLAPTFDVVRQPLPGYVLLLETSSSMARAWKWVRKATQNLIRFELPDNANLAVVTFNSEARVEHNLTPLTGERVRARMADTIPDSPNKLSRTEDRLVNRGVQVAMDQVLRNREAGGHLVVVTRGDGKTLSPTDQQIIEEYDKYYNVRVSSVLLREPQARPLDFYEDIAQRSGGISLQLDRTGPSMNLLSDLIAAFRRVVSVDSPLPSGLPVTVHRKTYTRSGARSTKGSFMLDSTLGRDTIFGVFVEDDEDHQIKSIKFTDSDGAIYGPYTKMSSTYDLINFKTINFKVGEKPPFDDVS